MIGFQFLIRYSASTLSCVMLKAANSGVLKENTQNRPVRHFVLQLNAYKSSENADCVGTV